MAVFSSTAAISIGWQTAKKNFKVLLTGTILLMLCSYLPSLLAQLTKQGRALESYAGAVGLYSFLGSLASLWISVGYIMVADKLLQGQTVTTGNFFPNIQAVVRYFVSGLVVGLFMVLLVAVIGGVLAAGFLVKGLTAPIIIISSVIALAVFILLLILSIRWSQVTYAAILDQDWPLKTLKQSWHLTRGNFWSLIGFGILSGVVNLLGLIVFFVGLLWTIPTTLIASVYVFQQLKKGQFNETK
ncbi:MAG: hypothetical protein V1846_05610 [Candidatus Komeilibacteria bacterium]